MQYRQFIWLDLDFRYLSKESRVEELVAVGVAQLVKVQLGALERGDRARRRRKRGIRRAWYAPRPPKHRTRSYRSPLDLLGWPGLELDVGMGRAGGSLCPSAPCQTEPLHVFRLGGLNPVARGGLEENACVTQRDGRLPLLVTMRRTGMTPWLSSRRERWLPSRACHRVRRRWPPFRCRAPRRRQSGGRLHGGGLWSAAAAGRANQSTSSEYTQESFIVDECII